MAILNANKVIDKSVLKCGETAKVTLSFDATSELVARPADIVLIIDRSSSMFGEKIDFAKKGINDLINIVAVASGDNTGTTILNKSKIGLVTFASDATSPAPLTDDVNLLNNAVNSISIGGLTNHSLAFEKAATLFDPLSTNDKIVIMFTDGVTTEGPDANIAADKLKADGVEIYAIGLLDNVTNLNRWATDPDSLHVVSTNDPRLLEDLFKKVAYEVAKAGAKGVAITETLNPDFKVVNLGTPSHGTTELKDLQTIIWTMDAIGTSQDDKASLSFDIAYIGDEKGKIVKEFNKTVEYSDREGTELTFPMPTVEVDCTEEVIIPDSCITNSTSFQIEGCVDAKSIEVAATAIQDLGRIVQVDVTLKNVCPNKRVGLGVILTEIDTDGIEHSRGMKTLVIRNTESDFCEDILVKCINFVVPEELDVTGLPDAMCNARNFKVRVLVNYIDTDFVCCDPTTVILK